MQETPEHAELLDVISWIDQHTRGLELPADDRSLIAIGCFDVAIEHQAAIAVLHGAELYGSMLALLRVLSESLVRGLWFSSCASEGDLAKFKNGTLRRKFEDFVSEYENAIGTPNGVLSGFKLSTYKQMNDFTHTGIRQVSRRHMRGRVQSNYSEQDLKRALSVAGSLGLIAAGQLIDLARREDLIRLYMAKVSQYGGN
ncbi:hypothetical protein J5T34_03580 [Cupriavidus gilardii]|nr:hypothetical protein [Cupriavidus gilardii]MBO4119819.1 hypothetical protein [Cupriavidus gilardii]